MIYIDIDGVCVDFIGTAKKFGAELEHNVFGAWEWNVHATPEHFYMIAELQPWFDSLIRLLTKENQNVEFLTVDYAEAKSEFLHRAQGAFICSVTEALDKSVHCKHPTDLLIDDNAAECKRWRDKGGIAYHFDIADPDPFGKFLAWWRLK